MKNIQILIYALIIFFSGCKKYEDYEIDYNKPTVYFGYQKPVRTLVAEGNTVTFEAGITLGGKRENDRDEIVEFKVDPSLLTDATLMNGKSFTLLPADYYTLSNSSKITIPTGSFNGAVTVTLNDKFINDPQSIMGTYVLPLLITSSTTESILRGSAATGVARKDYTLIVVKYISKYQATYYHRGFRYGLDAAGNVVDVLRYVRPEEETQYLKNHVWNLTTLSSTELMTDGVEFFTTQTGKNYRMKLSVANDGNVTVSNNPVSLINNIIPTDASKYDAAKKQFYLYYKYTDATGKTFKMSDTLLYRNVDLKLEQW